MLWFAYNSEGIKGNASAAQVVVCVCVCGSVHAIKYPFLAGTDTDAVSVASGVGEPFRKWECRLK